MSELAKKLINGTWASTTISIGTSAIVELVTRVKEMQDKGFLIDSIKPAIGQSSEKGKWYTIHYWKPEKQK